MGRDRTFSRCRRQVLFAVDGLAKTHLAIGAVDDPTFAFLAEDLALEPVELMLEGLDFLAQRHLRARQFDDLLRAESKRLVEAGDAG